jgi:hypothetical protein
MVTDEEARALEAPCTKEEIYQVLKGFKKEKSPGPDGWTVELYLHFFELMGQDLLEAIEDSRTRGLVNKHLNNTFIVLIPKQNLPRHFSDYRPISLCNLSYKIITKIIANRIRPLLSRALAEEQLGFLKGRQILDAIGTAQECLHSIKTKNIPAILLKLDLKQAFDCINWNFLHLILLQCGFGAATTNWMMGCITTATLAVLINGEASKAFHSERGLRQGCPLSPLLFILVLESLSILLKRSKLAGKLTGIKASRLTQILHLLFVDDVIIMTSDSLSEWTEILNVLNVFCSVTGLKINLQKSMFLATGARETILSELKTLFGIDFRDLEAGFNYLGYYIKPSSYKAKDWSWLYEKFERRIQHWCNRCLSMGGRYILIKAVLESLPVYWMALAHIPQSVLKKLRQLIFTFLWNGSKQSRGLHLCGWETLSKPKALGGWGLRNLHLSYLALSANTLWRILMVPGIWNKLIKDKYLSHLPVHSWLRSATFTPQGGSQTWKHLLKSLPILLHWIAWLPGTGTAIEIGKDDILGMGEKALLSPRLLERLHF